MMVTVDTTHSSAKGRTIQEERLAKLEEKLAHELLDDEERQELRDRIIPSGCAGGVRGRMASHTERTRSPRPRLTAAARAGDGPG